MMQKNNRWFVQAHLAFKALGLWAKEGKKVVPKAAGVACGVLLAVAGLGALGAGLLGAWDALRGQPAWAMIHVEPKQAPRWLEAGQALRSERLKQTARRAIENQRPTMFLASPGLLEDLAMNQERDRQAAAELEEARSFVRAIKNGASVEQAAAGIRAQAGASHHDGAIAWAREMASQAPRLSLGFGETLRSIAPGGERERAIFMARGMIAPVLGAMAIVAAMGLGMLGSVLLESLSGARSRVKDGVRARREEVESELQARELRQAAKTAPQGERPRL